jgi:hypothetical protein
VFVHVPHVVLNSSDEGTHALHRRFHYHDPLVLYPEGLSLSRWTASPLKVR